MSNNTLLLQTLAGHDTERPPVWVMRQAGRILPEYRALRASFANFKEFLYTSEATAEASLQPVNALGVDAVIVFSDILVIPEALGCVYEMVESKGPIFTNKIQNTDDILKLSNVDEAIEKLNYVFKTIKLVKNELKDSVPLIGFAGGPWTIFAYMTEGAGSKDFHTAKKWLYTRPKESHALLQVITDLTIAYLKEKIACGCQVIQLFDSWAGILSPVQFQSFSLPYLNQICKALSGTPVILFAKGSMQQLQQITKSECTAIGLDWSIDMKTAREVLGKQRIVQGNMDPCMLYASDDEIVSNTNNIINAANGHHIFNLGHGVYPDTDARKVKLMIDTVKQYRY